MRSLVSLEMGWHVAGVPDRTDPRLSRGRLTMELWNLTGSLSPGSLRGISLWLLESFGSSADNSIVSTPWAWLTPLDQLLDVLTRVELFLEYQMI